MFLAEERIEKVRTQVRFLQPNVILVHSICKAVTHWVSKGIWYPGQILNPALWLCITVGNMHMTAYSLNLIVGGLL